MKLRKMKRPKLVITASICVPVTITPYVQAGVITTKCCGAPIVTTGKVPCQGLKNGTCTFTIAQDICVSVPMNSGGQMQLWAMPMYIVVMQQQKMFVLIAQCLHHLFQNVQ